MEGADNDSPVIKSGYLLKKTKGTLKTFNKRWFVIRDGQLLYSKTHEDPEYIILAHDLRLLNVREVNGANYFEVVIVGSNSTFIKAETEEECKEWITALRKASEVLFHSTEAPRRPSGSAKEKIILKRSVNLPVSLIPPMSEMEIACRNIPGNKFCAECKTKDPEWISINLGIFVCVECSGAHRNVGAHISRIRSLKMDFINNYQWDILLNLGNDKVNSIFVTKCVPTLLNEDSSNDERETFIKSKYVDKIFYVKMEENDKLISFEWKSTVVRQDRLMNDCCLLEENMVFENIPVSDGWVQAKNETDLENIALDSIKNRDCAGILNCLVQGLEINKLICGAPLLNLVTNRNMPTMIELLVLNGAKPSVQDLDGNTALHIASSKNLLPILARFLMLVSLDEIEVKNKNGQTVLEVAQCELNFHVVALLNLFKIKEITQSKEGDEQFQHFLKEFKLAASWN